MLITENFLNLDDYSFQNSPSSSSDAASANNDYADSPSDEDFLQQLSSDLDIPLLLNPGEDELQVLNSFLDQSPEEILSELKSPYSDNSSDIKDDQNTQWSFDDLCDFTFKTELKFENEGLKGNKSNGLKHHNSEPINWNPVSDKLLETPPTSPESLQKVVINSKSEKKQANSVKRAIKLDNKVLGTNQSSKQQNVPKQTVKRQAVFTDKSTTNFNNKVLIIPSTNSNICNVPTYQTIQTNLSPKVIVIDSSARPLSLERTNSVSRNLNSCISIPSLQTTVPVLIKTEPDISSIPINFNSSMDPKVLKRQQRMIKNRESACLSRKKKKDYLTSLEKKVQELTTENEFLKNENSKLKDQLSKFLPNGSQTKTLTKAISLCLVLCLMFFNVDYLRLPHLSRKINFNGPDELSVLTPHVGRNLLWTSIEMDVSDNNMTDNKTNDTSNLMCPVYINQTENVRLALELQRWIGKPFSSNNTTNSTENIHKSNEKPFMKSRRLRKKLSTVDKNYASPVYQMKKRDKTLTSSNVNEIQVFAPGFDQKFSDFFEAINRQDDTFYLVSFSPDHMLLPAINHNKTRRPKMSLILPSLLNDDSSQLSMIPLMQIDCEVLDTQIIHVKNVTIPRHLREYNNTSSSAPNYSTNMNQTNNGHFNIENNYKPYFMRKSYLRNVKNEGKNKSKYKN